MLIWLLLVIFELNVWLQPDVVVRVFASINVLSMFNLRVETFPLGDCVVQSSGCRALNAK